MADNGNEKAHAAAVRGSALVLTNVMKVVGIVAFVNEAFVRGDPRDAVLAFCALLVFGAQRSEDFAMRVIDRIFARD